jgi:cobalt transporter subunit CbtB
MQTQLANALPATGSRASSRSGVTLGALAAGFFGAFILWGVGFSHIDVLHNAAHDVRHSSAFPCH